MNLVTNSASSHLLKSFSLTLAASLAEWRVSLSKASWNLMFTFKKEALIIFSYLPCPFLGTCEVLRAYKKTGLSFSYHIGVTGSVFKILFWLVKSHCCKLPVPLLPHTFPSISANKRGYYPWQSRSPPVQQWLNIMTVASRGNEGFFCKRKRTLSKETWVLVTALSLANCVVLAKPILYLCP